MVDTQDRVTQQGDTTYAYDNHGNVTKRTVGAAAEQTLAWDSTGGLITVTQAGAPTVSYMVDTQGRRVGRKLAGTLEREWLYDGQLRIVGEVVHTVPERVRVYGYLPERHLPVMMKETVGGVTTKTYRLYGDHLGSLRAVVDSDTGLAVQVMQHDAWGKVIFESVAGFVRVPFGFAGGIADEVTGLVRFGAREYDPGTGRWLSKDEARFDGGWNFYEYAAGDPANLIDPNGRLAGSFALAGKDIITGAFAGTTGSTMGGAGAVGATGLGAGYLYCLLIDCGNGPLGDFAPADEGPDEGGAPSSQPQQSGEPDAGVCAAAPSPGEKCRENCVAMHRGLYDQCSGERGKRRQKRCYEYASTILAECSAKCP